MLVAKDVYTYTYHGNLMRDKIKAGGGELEKSTDFEKDFIKRKFDAPDILFTLFELIASKMYAGEFSVTASKQEVFPFNSEEFSTPLLINNGFEVISLEGNMVKVSWEKGQDVVKTEPIR